jgi:NAD(P)-dependent dehydrogenase (short-subunit alcohol dehydrogenase family)
MKPAANVKNKRILITGGASGIGAEVALLLASRGAKVMIADLSEENGLKVVSHAKDKGNDIHFAKVDVASGDSVRALFAQSMQILGGLDVVINNAGIDHTPAPMHELSDDDFDSNIAVNLKGVWHCMRAAIGCLAPNGGGHVINVASVAGLRSSPMISAYSASKHGVIGLTKSAAGLPKFCRYTNGTKYARKTRRTRSKCDCESESNETIRQTRGNCRCYGMVMQ